MDKVRPPRQPKRSAVAAEDHDAYQRVMERFHPDDAQGDHPLGEYWGALLQSPPMCAIAAQLGIFFRAAGDRDSTYSHADREFVDQVLSAKWKTNVVQRRHIPDAVAAGVRLDAIRALRADRDEELNGDERLLATYIRQVVSGTVTDASYHAIEQRLGTRGLVEYTGFILWLQWIIRMYQAIGARDPSDEEIDQLIAELDPA